MSANSSQIIEKLEWGDTYSKMGWRSAVNLTCKLNGLAPISDEELFWCEVLQPDIENTTNKKLWRLPTTKELKEAFKKKVGGFEEKEYWSSHGAWPYPGKLTVEMRYGTEILRQVGFRGHTCLVRFVR